MTGPYHAIINTVTPLKGYRNECNFLALIFAFLDSTTFPP